MVADIADDVRSTCHDVLRSAQLVQINDHALQRFAATLDPSTETFGAQTGDPATSWEEEALLELALAAINFGSGWHDIVRKRDSLSGAITMATHLRDEATTSGLDPVRLQTITTADCHRIFDQPAELGLLMTQFARSLRDLGAFIDRSAATDDSTANFIDGCGRSAIALATELTAMPSFADVATLDNQPVAFYKRAQIAAADLSRASTRHHSRPLFDDLDRLTAFADNLVPHVLRVDGVLSYDEQLAAHIDRGSLLTAASRPEIEIRAAGVVAVERLAAMTGRTAMDLDSEIWNRGGRPHYKAIPRHRARSIFY